MSGFILRTRGGNLLQSVIRFTPPRRPAIEDPGLILKILSGDKDQYVELVRRHEDRVYRLCLGILGDPHEAEEAAQVTFVKAYRSLSSFKNQAAFSTWLTRIGINHCRDVLRRRKKRPFFSLDALLERSENPPEPLVGRPMETPEGFDEALRVMNSLPDKDREVLTLQEIEGFSYDEIAAQMGISVDAVKGRLKRARERIRHILKEKGV